MPIRALSRRAFLASSAGTLAGALSPFIRAAPQPEIACGSVDHLILGAADLGDGIDYVEQLTGLRAAVGGSHPGRGTRNALLSLGTGCYLEIIAPDPAQSVFDFVVDLRRLPAPRLVNWAARSADLDSAVRNLRALGEPMTGPRDGSRVRPDGQVLRWRTLAIGRRLGPPHVEPVPFLIHWAPDSPHPSADSPRGCTLGRFEILAPDARAVSSMLDAIGVQSRVLESAETRLQAVLDTPTGRITLA